MEAIAAYWGILFGWLALLAVLNVVGSWIAGRRRKQVRR